MKKKFNLIKLLIISIFLSYVSFSAQAASRCNNFYNDLVNNYKDYKLNYLTSYSNNDFGFILESKFNDDPKIDTWQWLKDSEGYYVVGAINDPNLIGKVQALDVIISANNLDLRKMKLKHLEKYFEDQFSDGEKVNFKFRRDFKKKPSTYFEIELQKKDKDLIMPEFDIYFRSIDVVQKENKIDVAMDIEWRYYFEEESGLYQAAKNNLFFINENGDKSVEHCNFNVDKWKSLDTAFDPPKGIEFIDLLKSDKNLRTSSYLVSAYSDEIQGHKREEWGNEGKVDYKSKGIFTFVNNFDLKNFPFDKQKVTIVLAIRDLPMSQKVVSVTDFSARSAIDFGRKNNINGWNIIDHTWKYEPYQGPNDSEYFDSLVFEIDIERKHDFYIYKVILPIILILMVCWSSLWITTREIESRLTITIVCLLSLIAYNFVIDKELPKLEYLTVLDWIILISYVYATIPNFISIISHKLFISNKKILCNKIENYGKKYGATSYVILVFLIIAINVNINPENASGLVSWMAGTK